MMILSPPRVKDWSEIVRSVHLDPVAGSVLVDVVRFFDDL